MNDACKSLGQDPQVFDYLFSRTVRCRPSGHCKHARIRQVGERGPRHDPMSACAARLLRCGVIHEPEATPDLSQAVERFKPVAITGKDEERGGLARGHLAACDLPAARNDARDPSSSTARATVCA